MINYDFGPWFIALNNKNEFFVHTYAQHFPFIQNVLNPNDNYRLFQLMGPFSDKEEALKIAHLWENDPSTGEQILNDFADLLGIKLWQNDYDLTINVSIPLSIKKIKKLKRLRI